MGLRAKFLVGQTGFVGRGGSGVMDVFAKDGEGAPQGKRLEGKDKLHIGPLGNTADERKVAAQFAFL